MAGYVFDQIGSTSIQLENQEWSSFVRCSRIVSQPPQDSLLAESDTTSKSLSPPAPSHSTGQLRLILTATNSLCHQWVNGGLNELSLDTAYGKNLPQIRVILTNTARLDYLLVLANN